VNQKLELSTPLQHEFMLCIGEGRPLQASELGEVLLALARDYRKINRGRDLAILRIESGSILVYLQDAAIAAAPYLKDAVEIAKGGKALFGFFNNIKDLLEKKQKKDTDLASVRKQGAYRSIEAMVKIAADSGSNIKITHTTEAGESLEVNLTAKNAEELRVRSHQNKLAPDNIRSNKHLSLPPTRKMITADHARLFADEIEKLALPGLSNPNPLIDMTVQLLLDSGNGHLVEVLAQELRDRGYNDLAAAVLAKRPTDQGRFSFTKT
jgi:hypothetical protein